MKVLIACEFSGVIRDAFIKHGHDAWSCDLLATDVTGPHIQADVLDIINQDWELMIAHPPCTYLANSGVQYLHTHPDRWAKMEEAAAFFMALLNCNIPRIAIENPLPHKYAKLPPYTQLIQPYEFGHNCMKKTCLWLKGLPLLKPTSVVHSGERWRTRRGRPNGSMWYSELAGNPTRWKERSKTFPGIAEAMATQWGSTTKVYKVGFGFA